MKGVTKARLAFVSHRFHHNDGQGRVSYEVVMAALERGYQVTILGTHCAKELMEHANARFVPIGKDWIPTTLLRNLVFAAYSTRWLRGHRSEIDLIQTNGFVTWAASDVAVAHFIHTTWAENPYFPFRALSPYALYQRTFTYLNGCWERRVYREARRVVAVSKLVARELIELKVLAKNITVIVNGVDIEQFHPGSPERRTFGLPEEVPLALFVGDIRTSRKNLDTLLYALCDVPELHLAVAGDVNKSPYPNLVHELQLSERVTFLGKTSNVPALMRSVDLFVFPSRYDPFGLVVLEAMASGVPVITSSHAGVTEYIGDAGSTLDDPNGIEALANQMANLLGSATMRSAMGHAGRRRAEQMQWSTMTASYLEMYDQLS